MSDSSKQAIAGLVPPDVAETPLMTVWPSIGAWMPGRLVGQLASMRVGGGFFTVGKLFALATIPISLAVYAWRLMPFLAQRYTLTSRRILIQRGLVPAVSHALELDGFDSIGVEVRGGQEWLRAGDLVFWRDGREVFRLAGVSKPEPFRQTCLKAQRALQTVREVLEQQRKIA